MQRSNGGALVGVLLVLGLATCATAFVPHSPLSGLRIGGVGSKTPPPARGCLAARPPLLGLHATAVGTSEATEAGEMVVPPPLTSTPPIKIDVMVEPTPFTHVSGYSNRYMEMLDYLGKAGDSVEIMTSDDIENPPSDYNGYPIRYTPGFRFALYNDLCLSFDHTFRGIKMLREHKPDVLHISTPGFMVLVASVYARAMNVPVVMSYHTHLPVYADRYMGFFPFIVPISWLCIKFIHAFADLTLVTSPQMKADFESYGIDRVEVWRKGINTDNFNPKWKSAEMRKRLCGGEDAADDETLLIYVGRLGVEKRIQDLRAVLDANPKLRLAVVGQGPYRAALEEIFEGTKTHFTGIMRGEELWGAFASADVFAMPSDSETLGFVVLEAQASGIPVVGVRAGGVPDLIKQGENGYLVPTGDMVAFGERVKELAGDREKMARMGAAGREWAELWSWESATSVLRNLQYPRAIENSRRANEGTPGPLKFLQLAFLALTGLTSASIVGAGCLMLDVYKWLTKEQAAP